MKASRSTWVSLEPRKGTCAEGAVEPSARMHSLSASRDLLISAPSCRVLRSDMQVSAPRSLPARSINDSLRDAAPAEAGERSPRDIWKMECEREEVSFADVLPVVRAFVPASIKFSTSCAFATTFSTMPTSFTSPLWSSITFTCFRPASRSKHLPPYISTKEMLTAKPRRLAPARMARTAAEYTEDMVYVLPEPVWPCANAVAMHPWSPTTSCTRGLMATLYTS
mmetsp:Transcript_37021/g.70976  ORF Transcript_37021/g.70976 Transcript_37021/m.70976 type:complete len:224 (-) Transcript_37021:90-761(-)